MNENGLAREVVRIYCMNVQNVLLGVNGSFKRYLVQNGNEST